MKRIKEKSIIEIDLVSEEDMIAWSQQILEKGKQKR